MNDAAPPAGTHAERMRALADRYRDAFARGDAAAMGACYAPGARIVQVVTDRTLTVEQSLTVVPWLHRKLPDLHLREARTTVTEDGFVQQYLVCGTTAEGAEVRSPTCLVVRVGPDGITGIEEYFDRVATEAIA
jgi:ketosteroid isomerase-like protein